MHVRPARPGDADAACDVLRRSITELCVQDHRQDEAFLARWLSNKTPENVRGWIAGSHVFVAEEEGRVVGVGSLDASGHITLNYVAPEARFRGVSKAMLRALEDKAVELGCLLCMLESTRTAERFYRAAGYRERAGEPERVMEKSLRKPSKTEA